MNRTRCSQTSLAILLLQFVAFASVSIAKASTWQEQVLYSFQSGSDGQEPVGGVVFDSQGNLYGATIQGGSASCGGCGTVYQLSKQGGTWTETVLHVFDQRKDGQTPEGGVLIDHAGNLYGTTAYGGAGGCTLLGKAFGCGTVFELTPPVKPGGAWTETVLYSFQGNKDGYFPWGNLILDRDGNIYGATQFGGGYGSCNALYPYCGTVFKLMRPAKKGGKWTEAVLHSFGNGDDGANPNGGLMLDGGALYGTTYGGGGVCRSIGCGVVFKLTAKKQKNARWEEDILYRFKGDPDGADPAAGVIADQNGNLFGTTQYGGAEHAGTAFQLAVVKHSSYREMLLCSFNDGNTGLEPMAAPVFDATGNLYGTALGGNQPGGVVFELQPQSKEPIWTLSVLYNFTGGQDGAAPTSGLTWDKGGNLYSVTQGGGTGSCYGGCGTVFELTP